MYTSIDYKMNKIGIFLVSYKKIDNGKKWRTLKEFTFICEFEVNDKNLFERVKHYKNLYKDFNYYFCEYDNGYYYFNSSKKRIELEVKK